VRSKQPTAGATSRARESLLRFWPLGEPRETLRQRVADDAALMRIVACARPDTIAQDQTCRVLFAAISYLAAKHGFRAPANGAWRSFVTLRAALLNHSDELRKLLGRPVQINDPLRCVALYAGLAFAARRVRARLALLEVGPSLGLNLCMDRYGYEYRGAGRSGAADSSCRLTADVDDLAARGRARAARAFTVPKHAPLVGERIGLELDPVSLDEDSVAWMRAFHSGPAQRRFDRALAVRRELPLQIVAGDASETLGPALANVPRAQVPLVFHTAVAYQMPAEARERMLACLAQVAVARRVLYMTWAESPARRGAPLEVTDLNLARGRAERCLLAFVNRWEPVPKLEWVYPREPDDAIRSGKRGRASPRARAKTVRSRRRTRGASATG
jgi:hypothetical protein